MKAKTVAERSRGSLVLNEIGVAVHVLPVYAIVKNKF
jgi:hypothetical protein